MANVVLTDEQVEMEIARLQASEHVKLAQAEIRVKNRRRQYLYHLRHLEKRGKVLEQTGWTPYGVDGADDEEEG